MKARNILIFLLAFLDLGAQGGGCVFNTFTLGSADGYAFKYAT